MFKNLNSRFIDKYGTHIVVGVRMGGKDVVHIKQLHNSNLHPTEVQELLKQLADERFSEDGTASESNDLSGKTKVGRILNCTTLPLFLRILCASVLSWYEIMKVEVLEIDEVTYFNYNFMFVVSA